MPHTNANSIIADLTDQVMEAFHNIKGCLEVVTPEGYDDRLLKKISKMTEDILDDLITENLFWTDDVTVATPDRYSATLPVKAGKIDELETHIDVHIANMEVFLKGLDILPSWSYFEVVSRSTCYFITYYGDYRIEDWMERHGKTEVKPTRLSL